MGFEAWCHYLSQTLNLDNLSVHFKINEEDIRQLSFAERDFSPLVGLRKLHVNKHFDVYLYINTWGVHHWFHDADDEQAEASYADSLEAEWKPFLRESLLLDTLRAEVESEQTNYLRSHQQVLPPKDTTN